MSRAERLSAPLRVLVVDDDADTVASQFDMLTLCGFTVETAANGDDALRAVHVFRPEVILTDLMMPGISGCELARQVLSAGLSPRPFLVAVTGCYGNDLRESEGAGFDLVLIKPAEPDGLITVLRRVADARE